IPRNKEHPDLGLWACPGTQREQDQVNEKIMLTSQDSIKPSERVTYGQNYKGTPNVLRKMGDTYITSEHSYQKPQSSGHGCKSSNDPASSDDEDGMCLELEDPEFLMDTKTSLRDSLTIERRNEQNLVEENTVQMCNEKRGAEVQVESQLQWQLNLLTHIENVQNEVTSRMDLIEKEVDGTVEFVNFTLYVCFSATCCRYSTFISMAGNIATTKAGPCG
ncbi:hypothetical protein FKM82_022805, partial [Ascaphus truei]